MNVGGPILVSQSIFFSIFYLSLGKQSSKALFTMATYVGKGVISDCDPSYTQYVKKVCTQKSVSFLKDCLTEPKKTVPSYKVLFLGNVISLLSSFQAALSYFVLPFRIVFT